MAGHYQLAGKAIVKSRETNRWSVEDISKTSLSKLFQLYRKMEIPITDLYGDKKTLDPAHYETDMRNSNLTILQWLISIGNQALIVTPGHTKLETVEAHYLPLTLHKGTFKMAQRGAHPSHEAAVEDYDDLIVDLEGVSPSDLHLQCLFTINGLVMPTTYHKYGCRVKNAGDIVRKSGHFSGGILDFSAIGTITQIPLTKDNVFKVSDDHTYFDQLVINTRVNLTNKTVGIVIGGHLHVLDGVVRVIGDTAITVNLRNSRYVERVLETQNALDLEMMGLEDIESQSVMSHVTSDEAILKYITSPYSFLVIFNNSEMFVDTAGVSQSAKMGSYVVPDTRKLTRMVDHLGRGIDYWPMQGENIWVLNSTDSHRQTYMHQRTDWLNLVRMNDGAQPARPVDKIDPLMIHFKARKK